MIKIPCETCLKFPICISKLTVKCTDLYMHIHTHHGDGYTSVDLDGRDRNMREARKVETLFKRYIMGVNRLNEYKVFFSNSRIGE